MFSLVTFNHIKSVKLNFRYRMVGPLAWSLVVWFHWFWLLCYLDFDYLKQFVSAILAEFDIIVNMVYFIFFARINPLIEYGNIITWPLNLARKLLTMIVVVILWKTGVVELAALHAKGCSNVEWIASVWCWMVAA